MRAAMQSASWRQEDILFAPILKEKNGNCFLAVFEIVMILISTRTVRFSPLIAIWNGTGDCPGIGPPESITVSSAANTVGARAPLYGRITILIAFRKPLTSALARL